MRGLGGLRRAWRRIDAGLMRVAARSGPLSTAYVALFKRTLDRANRAMVSGWVRYATDTRAPEESSTLLRRNIHRIEKGLLMRPRRAVFATEYIEETAVAFTLLAKSCAIRTRNVEELGWARDVLVRYFELVGAHPRVERARRVFDVAVGGLPGDAPSRVPTRRGGQPISDAAREAFFEVCRHRKSVRWFQDRPVPRRLLDRAVEAASLAPSACNRQPFVFRIFDEPDLVRRVASIPMGTAGYAENVPVFVVVVGRQRHYFHERDRNLIYIDGSLAAMSFVLAAEAQGLSTCCVNWPLIEGREREMAGALALETDERPILCVAVGYGDPDGYVAHSARKPLPLLRRYNLR